MRGGESCCTPPLLSETDKLAGIALVNEIPKSASGKILRRELRRMEAARQPIVAKL